jgi:purine nucleosidase
MRRTTRLIFICLLSCCLLTSFAQRKKVIIDCDLGGDDAMELVLALQSPELEIVGITINSADIDIGKKTKNALRVVELSGKNIPVFEGATRPLVFAPLIGAPEHVQEANGLGNTMQKQPQPKISAQQKPAAQFIAEIAKAYPGQITIVAEGILTNLADAIRMDTTVVHNIKEVVVVGGALRVPGLITPVAEPNVWVDPHAADLVFTTPWKVTMFALDVTMKVVLPEALMERIKNENSKYGQFVYSISREYRDFQMKLLHTEGMIDIGAAAILYLVDSSLFKYKKGPVRVVTDGIARGQTIMPAYSFQSQLPEWKGKPDVSAAYEVDAERYLKAYEAIMLRKRQ